MASSTLLTVSLAMLLGAHAVGGAHLHPPRSGSTTETRENSGGTFSIRQTRNAAYKAKSGLEAMIDVYKKYGVELTPQLKKAVQINSHFAASQRRQTVEAVPPQGLDYEWVSPVQFGTPPQTMYLSFDTGSSDTWVFSTDTNAIDVGEQKLYSPANSSTAQIQQGYSFSIGYGDGSGAKGMVYRDRVEVAGYATNQAFGSATTVSDQFTDDDYCWGLFGLGMTIGNTIKPVKQPTFMDNIKTSLAQPLFTADLKSGVPGTYGFGFIGNTYSGNIQYAPIDQTSPYWLFAVTGYRIGPATIPGNPNSGYVTKPFRAIVDTSTTLLLLPPDIVDAYWKLVPGAYWDAEWAAVMFPCGTKLMDFTYGIGLYKGVVPGRYINYGTVDDDGILCYGGLQAQGDFGFAIIGGIALKAQYAIFDLGNMRVGMANKPLTT